MHDASRQQREGPCPYQGKGKKHPLRMAVAGHLIAPCGQQGSWQNGKYIRG